MVHANEGSKLRDIILGGQDGLVNVLGIVLAVASATSDPKVVIIAGIAATFAESISMAAVGYTSMKAEKEYYDRVFEDEKKLIHEKPEEEKREVRDIFRAKGFRGGALENIVRTITKDKKIWLNVMMSEEHNLPNQTDDPLYSSIVIGASAFVGSLIPLAPFFFMPVGNAMIGSVLFSAITLFIAGAVKTRVTIGNWWKSGIELTAIGMLAALAGFIIGKILGVVV